MTLKKMKSLTYEQAADLMKYGIISIAEFDEYCYYWQNSCYRYSSLCADYDINRDSLVY